MSAIGGSKAWFTAQELADLALPGLPKTKRKINELAVESGWGFAITAGGETMSRKRAGRGGGLEYHCKLLPTPTFLALIKRGMVAPTVDVTAPAGRDQAWAWFEGQNEAIRAEAHARLGAVDAIDALVASGMSRSAAVTAIGVQRGTSAATLWNWLKLAAGVERSDRLPALAPRRTGGGAEAELHPAAWKAFKSDYLRPEKPTFAACHGRLERMAAEQGWGAIPHVKTLQRKLERDMNVRTVTLAREGVDMLRRSLPPQERSVAQLHALQHVNIDGHKWDVFVKWPDGHIARPLMVAIQDLYSRKTLAWRIAETESAQDVRLAFADLFRLYGIPGECTLDNGRGFASKWITGGTPNRFRFKVQDGDPVGLLTALGVKIWWTLPYRGQSKPIERMFRDFCGRIATHPAFAGAYTGNKPDAKPDNYGASAVPLDVFRRVVGAEIAAHNAREGRDTEMTRGVLSFDQVFQESYARSPVRKAGAEQLRLALLAADKVRADPKSGAFELYGNRYWSDELFRVAGQQLVVRFDPDDLQTEVHVYELGGRYVCAAPVYRAVGFIDLDAAKARARLEARHRKGTREALKAEQLMDAADLAALLPDPIDPMPMSPAVIRPVRIRGNLAVELKPTDAPTRAPLIDRFVEAERRLRIVE